jgi:Mn-dependent DtxR family transcriptional regulator
MNLERLHLLNSLKVYWWIKAYIEKHGESPTCIDVAIAFSINKWSVNNAVKTLHSMGLIEAKPMFDRPFRILKEAGGYEQKQV